MNSPLVSVIIPVFNREKLLARALESLLGQTYQNWEAIVVDDGTTDRSALTALAYAERDNRFRVLIRENGGAAAARNSALPYVSGKYVTFLDSDDEYAEEHLRLRVEHMERHPEIDIVHGGMEVFGDPWVPDRRNPGMLVDVRGCVAGATVFAKGEALTRLSGFRNLSYAEDSDLIERAEKLLNVGRFTEKTYRYYRDTADSVTRDTARHHNSALPSIT